MDDQLLRGHIYYVESNAMSTPIGSEIWSDRPALIVSNDTLNKTSGVVQIVYLTTSIKRHATPLLIPVISGSKQALANCSQVHSVDKSRVKQCMGQVTDEQMHEVDEALAMSLGFNQNRYRGLFKKWENYIREYNLDVKEELISIKEVMADRAVKTLLKQIDILQKERDGYRALAESRQELIDCVQQNKIL